MLSLAVLPLLVASAFAGDLIGIAPLPQYTQEQNTATGEYGYSYSGGPSSKTEFRALDGTTTGAYSYVDAHGLLQTVNYIADEFGFRAAGTNIPSEGSVPLDAPDVAVAKAAHLAEHSRATLEALSHHRKKRGALLPALAVAPVAPIAVPLATSSQSRFQIHRSAHLIQPVIAHSLLYRKKRSLVEPIAYSPLPPSSAKILTESVPLAPAAATVEVRSSPVYSTYVHHLPLATSSQSRFQIHNDAKIIEHIPIAAAPAIVEAKAALPVAAAPAIVEAKAALPVATPVIAKAALPVVEAALPLSTSSQSRFQIHKTTKIVEHIPVAAAPIVEAKAALPVAAPIVETKAAYAYPIFQSAYPLSTSSQSRFQIHNGAKIIQEFHQPIYAAAAVAAPAGVAVAPADLPSPVLSELPASEAVIAENDAIAVESA